LEKLDGARVEAPLLVAWRQQRVLVAAAQAQLGASAAWPQLGWARVKSSQAQPQEQPRALE
jgi:hypothetical protein